MKTDGSDQNQKGQTSTAVAKATNPVKTLREQVEKMMPEFQKALAGKITPERFMRITVTAIQQAPKLAECSQISFFGALMNSCQLGLEPNTPLGQAYLIPRWNGSKKRLECNFQLGYQGIINLATRTKQYKRIGAEIVYEGDEFRWEYGKNADLYHKPCGNTDKPTHVYAEYELTNGGYVFKVWTWAMVMNHAEQFSESFNKGFSPWKTNQESQEAMAKKTVLVNLLKYAPKTVEVAEAVNSDEHTLNMRTVNDGQTSFVTYDIDTPASPADTFPESESQEEREKQKDEVEPSQQTTGGEIRNLWQRGGNGNNNADITPRRRASGLFSKSEEDELEEGYMRQQERVEAPDFD
jgi:recombination protein RecT